MASSVDIFTLQANWCQSKVGVRLALTKCCFRSESEFVPTLLGCFFKADSVIGIDAETNMRRERN